MVDNEVLVVNFYFSGENLLRFVGVKGQNWDHVMKYFDGNCWVDQMAYEKVKSIVDNQQIITDKVVEIWTRKKEE